MIPRTVALESSQDVVVIDSITDHEDRRADPAVEIEPASEASESAPRRRPQGSPEIPKRMTALRNVGKTPFELTRQDHRLWRSGLTPPALEPYSYHPLVETLMAMSKGFVKYRAEKPPAPSDVFHGFDRLNTWISPATSTWSTTMA